MLKWGDGRYRHHGFIQVSDNGAHLHSSPTDIVSFLVYYSCNEGNFQGLLLGPSYRMSFIPQARVLIIGIPLIVEHGYPNYTCTFTNWEMDLWPYWVHYD